MRCVLASSSTTHVVRAAQSSRGFFFFLKCIAREFRCFLLIVRSLADGQFTCSACADCFVYQQTRNPFDSRFPAVGQAPIWAQLQWQSHSSNFQPGPVFWIERPTRNTRARSANRDSSSSAVVPTDPVGICDLTRIPDAARLISTFRKR